MPPPGSPPPKFDNVQPYYYGGSGEKGQGQYNTIAEGAAPELSPAKEQPKILGLRKRTFYIILLVLIAIIILAVGLGAGLAIGLKKDNNDSSNDSNSNDKS